MKHLIVVVALAFATAALAAELGDEPVPEGVLQGPSSSRLAREIEVRFGEEYNEKAQLMDPSGKKVTGTSQKHDAALRTYALSVARRHFEDASWSKDALKKLSVKKAKGRKGLELVVQKVSLVVNPGPYYNATVVVDRVQHGRRLGQATGRGFGQADRTRERTAAAFAPGPFGLAMHHKASQAAPNKDQLAIQMAILQAFDSACLQLAAPWAGEQMIEEMQKKR